MQHRQSFVFSGNELGKLKSRLSTSCRNTRVTIVETVVGEIRVEDCWGKQRLYIGGDEYPSNTFGSESIEYVTLDKSFEHDSSVAKQSMLIVLKPGKGEE